MPYMPPEAVQEALARQGHAVVASSQMPAPSFQHPHLRPAAGAFAQSDSGVDGKSVLIGMVIALGLGTAGYFVKRALS